MLSIAERQIVHDERKFKKSLRLYGWLSLLPLALTFVLFVFTRTFSSRAPAWLTIYVVPLCLIASLIPIGHLLNRLRMYWIHQRWFAHWQISRLVEKAIAE